MDPLENPFSPGAGFPPPELVGRDTILKQAQIALHRLRAGRPAKSMILVGLGGVGKTVLLNRIRLIAEDDFNSIISLSAAAPLKNNSARGNTLRCACACASRAGGTAYPTFIFITVRGPQAHPRQSSRFGSYRSVSLRRLPTALAAIPIPTKTREAGSGVGDAP